MLKLLYCKLSVFILCYHCKQNTAQSRFTSCLYGNRPFLMISCAFFLSVILFIYNIIFNWLFWYLSVTSPFKNSFIDFVAPHIGTVSNTKQWFTIFKIELIIDKDLKMFKFGCQGDDWSVEKILTISRLYLWHLKVYLQGYRILKNTFIFYASTVWSKQKYNSPERYLFSRWLNCLILSVVQKCPVYRDCPSTGLQKHLFSIDSLCTDSAQKLTTHK